MKAALIVLCGFVATACTSRAPLRRFEFTAEKMATPFRLVFYAGSRDEAEAAAAAAYARVDELEHELSDWREDSEVAALRRACADGPVGPLPIGRDLLENFVVAQRIAAASDGAFDVTVGPLVELWRRAKRREELPKPAEIDAARAHVGFAKVVVDAEQSTVTFTSGGVRLDLGGIAKGFAADETLKLLATRGITRALVAAGGDIVVADPPPDATGWRVELAEFEETAPPRTLLSLAHAAVSTSGDTYRFVEIDGIRYSHIVDPRTGMGLTRRLLVSVVAREGITADALATAVSAADPARALSIVAGEPGAEVRVVALENGVPEACASPGFARMMLGATPSSTVATPARH